MIEVYLKLLCTMALVNTAVSYCPREKIAYTSYCSFRIYCIGTIRSVSLPTHCQGSTNFAVNVDLTLSDAIERFDPHINDTDFLESVTTLRVSAKWPSTTLSLLAYMPYLRNLYLVGNDIQEIKGSPFNNLRMLENVDLSHNGLQDIDNLFESQLNKLKKVSLAHNKLQEIPGDVFVELSSLKELDLSYNFISDLDEEPFLNLTSLEILRLNNNNIKDLNGAVNNLKHLKHLFLGGNQIQNIDDESLQVIYHLETFDVSENQLEKLKPIVFFRHWGHVAGVCKIILSQNQITSIPNGNKNLSARFTRDLESHKIDIQTRVDLSNNIISNIEYNAFQSVVEMISLDLSCNKLLDFKVNPEDMKQLKYLNLSTNFIEHLYFDSFSSMANLENLDLSYNDLFYLPDETFTNNYNLRYLNMTFNEIDKLENLPIKMFHSKGGVLDLSNNGLSKLNIPFGQGLRLTVLVLQSNNISDASTINLRYQNELKKLELNRNNIIQLDDKSLHLPSSLKILDMRENGVEKIGPSTFHTLGHLDTLYLGYNKLTNIEYGTFNGLSELTTLDLSHNNITYLTSKVLMDLKSLTVLFLNSNGLNYLEYNTWFSHQLTLNVHLDDNNFSCEWLSRALHDFHNGYSRMRPTVNRVDKSDKNSLEGIPCENKDNKLMNAEDFTQDVNVDERLLVTNQKILHAVREQTYFLRIFLTKMEKNTKNK